MMTLALWDLSGLIGGLLLVLVCQVPLHGLRGPTS